MIALAAAALLRMAYASLIAGVGVSVVFSVAVFGAVRASDMRRSGRAGGSLGYAALAGLGILVSAAIVIYGLIVIVHKG